MQKLTSTEEEVMNHIWEIGPCTVSQILERYDTAPPHSTISSVARILEKKGFLSHKAYGRTYEYHVVISKSAYKRRFLKDVMSRFFGNSPQALVSFLVEEEEFNKEEMEELIHSIKKKKS